MRRGVTMTISKANELVDKYAVYEDYKKFVYYDDALKIVIKMLDEIDTLKVEISKNEAKIYAYEAILENSNFKMAVINKAKKNNDEYTDNR